MLLESLATLHAFYNGVTNEKASVSPCCTRCITVQSLLADLSESFGEGKIRLLSVCSLFFYDVKVLQ